MVTDRKPGPLVEIIEDVVMGTELYGDNATPILAELCAKEIVAELMARNPQFTAALDEALKKD